MYRFIRHAGRLLDHLQNTAAFMYVNVSFIVFDEADRVLDLDLRRISKLF